MKGCIQKSGFVEGAAVAAAAVAAAAFGLLCNLFCLLQNNFHFRNNWQLF